MTNIISFVSSQTSRRTRDPRGDEGGPGQVIIFPGVRYCRDAEAGRPQAATAPAPERKPTSR